jgi:Lrp/AsnC family leucine-responsive transcriptional regulator
MLIKAVYPTPTELNSFVGSLQRFGKTQTQIVFSTVVEPREII